MEDFLQGRSPSAYTLVSGIKTQCLEVSLTGAGGWFTQMPNFHPIAAVCSHQQGNDGKGSNSSKWITVWDPKRPCLTKSFRKFFQGTAPTADQALPAGFAGLASHMIRGHPWAAGMWNAQRGQKPLKVELWHVMAAGAGDSLELGKYKLWIIWKDKWRSRALKWLQFAPRD